MGTILNYHFLDYLNDYFFGDEIIKNNQLVLIACLMSIKSVTAIEVIEHKIGHSSGIFGLVFGESLMNDICTLVIFEDIIQTASI